MREPKGRAVGARAWLVSATLAGAGACTDRPAGDGTAGGGSSETTAAETTMAETATADTTADTMAVDSTGLPPMECPVSPAPDAVACPDTGPAQVSFSVMSEGQELQEAVDETCLVIDRVEDAAGIQVAFECPSRVVVLDITSSPVPPLVFVAVGQDIDLFYSGGSAERMLSLDFPFENGGVIFAALDGSALPPPEDAFFEAVSLSLLPTLCPTTAEGCIGVQPAALAVEFDGLTAELGAGEQATLGALIAFEVTAGRLERVECTDPLCAEPWPDARVQVMVSYIPEG